MSHDSFATVLLEMYETQNNCNVKFLCVDPTNKVGKKKIGKSSVEAHQLILSVNSDVFNTMFFGPVEAKKDFMNPGIDITDINILTFKMMLGFMYGKKLQLENVKMAFDFYYAVHKYNCKDALLFVTQYLSKETSPENSILIYQEIEKFNNSNITMACLTKFASDTRKILASDQFFEATPVTIAAMFALDSLTIASEKDLITALERYIEHHKTNDPEIAVKVRPALKNIRFLTLPANQIIRTTLLTMEEKHFIIEGLNPDSNLTKMPEGFSLNANKRSSIIERQKMVHALSDVFSSKMCFYCVKSSKNKCLHAIWSCPNMVASGKATLQAIFQKYNHTSLMEYNSLDLRSIYSVYKAWQHVD